MVSDADLAARLQALEDDIATIQKQFRDDPMLSATAAGRMPVLLGRELAADQSAQSEDGQIAFATDGEKRNEALGAGTGIPDWFDLDTKTYRRFSDDLEVGSSRKLDLGEFSDFITPLPHAENYVSSSAATTISDTVTFFQVAGTFTNSVVGIGFTSAADGQLTYTASRTRMVHIFSSWGVSSASNNQVIEVGIRKNGVIVTASIIARKIAVAGDVGSSALHSMITIATGDTIDVGVRNTSGSNDLTFDRLNLGVLTSPNDMTGITVP